MISLSGLKAVRKISATGMTHARVARTTKISSGDHFFITFPRGMGFQPMSSSHTWVENPCHRHLSSLLPHHAKLDQREDHDDQEQQPAHRRAVAQAIEVERGFVDVLHEHAGRERWPAARDHEGLAEDLERADDVD